jgi:catechol 2,3-dioxygenase-like lactoylglutathione lyase family enzyme
MPSISGLNHIMLAVADLDRSIVFYRDLLGCTLRAFWPDGAYLEAGSLWLCLLRDEAARSGPHPDYTHIAFSVAPGDFAAMSEQVRATATIWKDNRSEGDSLYFLDPDGHKLELHVGSLQSRLDHYSKQTDGNVTIIG